MSEETEPIIAAKGAHANGFLRRILRFLLPRPLHAKERAAMLGNIKEGAAASRRFYILLAFSTTIAAFGLLANSAAVIIGAMIVAPLMGPILGLALGMISGDHKLERTALIAEISGVALAVAIGVMIGHFPLKLGVSSEMFARTSPTAYDLCIAFVSGLVGGYASVNPKVNSAFAGVAVAVALVPPLATSGLLLAMGDPREAMGAFLLFLANFFSIQVAAALVFILFGLGSNRHGLKPGKSQVLVRFAPGVVALVLMGWYMTGTLAKLVKEHQTEEVVRSTLSAQIARRTGGRLEQIIRLEERDGTFRIVASTLTPAVFQAAQVKQIEQDLTKALDRRVSLVLRSIVSQDMNRDGRVYLTDEERQQSAKSSEEASYLQRARSIVVKGLESIQGAWLSSLERSEQSGKVVLTVTVQGPVQVSPAEVATLQSELQQELSGDVRVVVRNVSTRDVDASGYLYEAQPAPLSQRDPALFALRNRIHNVLSRRMAVKPARTLTNVEVRRSGKLIETYAEVEATQPVRPDEVLRIQADLRRYADSGIVLSVRTTLAATASPTGWEH